MTEKKLSERMKKGGSGVLYCLPEVIKDVEALEVENQKLKEQVQECQYKYNYEYQWHQTDNQRIRDAEAKLLKAEAEVTDLKMEIEGDEEREEVLEKEIGDLKGQIIGLNELNHGLDYCAEQEETKRKDAESRLAKAQELIRFYESHYGNKTSILNQIKEALK